MGAIVTDDISKKGRENLFHGSVSGKGWWSGFLQSWPKLVQQKPQHLSKQRALAGNMEIVQEYFKKVEKLIDKLGINDSEDMGSRLKLECQLSKSYLQGMDPNGYTR